MGAAADSAHEYLLKQFLLTGQRDMANLEMCTSTARRVYQSRPDHFQIASR